MRIHEIILEQNQPGIGQPVRSVTRTKVEIGSTALPHQSFRWKVTVLRGGDEDDVTHEFTTVGGRDEADKIAKQWVKKTLGLRRNPKAGEYFLEPVSRIANIGSGVYSDVRLHPSQHEIVKRERYPGEDRGGRAWTEAVVKYNETNPLGNPWLPYITELRTVIDPEDVTRTQTTQGRLESGFDLSLEAIEALANRIFPNFEISIMQKSRDSFTHWSKFVHMVDEIRRNPKLPTEKTTTKKVKGRVVEVPNPYYTEDENMLEALALVSQTARKYKVAHDIHTENIMVRNTGRGWQPVITDPLE